MFTILTLNVFIGSPLPYIFNGTSGLAYSNRLDRLIDYLSDSDVDVVCLQELYCSWSRAYIQKRLPMYHMASTTIDARTNMGRIRIMLLWFITGGLIWMILRGFLWTATQIIPLSSISYYDVDYGTLNSIIFTMCLIIGRYICRYAALENWLRGDHTGLTILWKPKSLKLLQHEQTLFESQEGDWMNTVLLRGFQVAAFELPCKRVITIINTHLNALGDDTSRLSQIKQLLAFNGVNCVNEAAANTTLLAGDFNIGPQSISINQILENGFKDCGGVDMGYTWDNINMYTQGWMRIPNERIDFIFHKPGPKCDINVVLSELVLQKNPVSDHYGVLAVIKM